MGVFMGNVIAGITASILTFFFVFLKKKWEQKRKFVHLEGQYAHYSIAGKPLGSGITHIKYRKGNILITEGKGIDGEWEGRLTMIEDVPEYGKGIYQYKGKVDCGLHEIQFNPQDKSIYVLTKNTSHGKEYTFSYIWRRL